MQKDKKSQSNFKVTIKQKLLASSYPVNNTPEAYFPYPPYAQQSQVISTIHQTILSSQNALIESPTGTGKTLCLLVGSLSALKVIHQRTIKIFYLTRTHSQISQVIDEMKKTCYNAKVNIIASRDHFCVNPNTKEMKGRVLEKACNDLVNNKTCLFKQSDKIPHLKNETMALEDFKDQCRKQLVCPFFYSRDLTEKTEISILPFNYFLDWKIFQTFSHLIKDSVVIFDQAHNVDSVAQEGGNLEIDCKQLIFAINELKQLERKFKFDSEGNINSKNQIKIASTVLERLKNSIESCKSKIFCSKSELEEFIEKSTTISDPQCPTETIYGLELNDNVPFFQNFHQVTKLFFKKQTSLSNFSNIVASLEKLCTLYKTQRFDKDFIVKIASDEEEKHSLRLKCLSPSVGFQRLKSSHPRSIILSSGTMGNLDNWQRYLKIPFQQKLSISSFITKNQLLASIVPKSQTGYTFQFTYHKKDSENQHRELAQELRFVETTIPKGNGIVVAFSTYLLMEKVIKYCGILKKKVFYQSKGSDVAKTFGQYAETAKQDGAFLFIVMKGRFSEGINFSDYLCRCLVVVGIPFLPRKETNVQEKIQYLKQNFSSEDAQAWYMDQTFQAVNQTIGRVIRNKKDYGVILLLDQRYMKKDNFQLLPTWFKNCSGNLSTEVLYKEIKEFFAKQSWLKSQTAIESENSNQISSIKTVRANQMKKKHLKLRYDSQQKEKTTTKRSKSSNSRSSNKSKQNNANRLLVTPTKKVTNKKSNEKSQLFKTPKHPPNSHNTFSASIVLSKINLDKKQKLKGFVNSRTMNFQKSKLLENFMKGGDNEDTCQGNAKQDEIKSNKKETNVKTEVKKVSKKIKKQCQFDQFSPFLQYFMG